MHLLKYNCIYCAIPSVHMQNATATTTERLPCYRPYGHTNISWRQLHTLCHATDLMDKTTYKCLQDFLLHTNVSWRQLHTHCHATDLMDIQMSPGENYIQMSPGKKTTSNVSWRNLHTNQKSFAELSYGHG